MTPNVANKESSSTMFDDKDMLSKTSSSSYIIPTGVLDETEDYVDPGEAMRRMDEARRRLEKIQQQDEHRRDELNSNSTSWRSEILWGKVAFMVVFHGLALFGLYLLFAGRVKTETVVWMFAVGMLSGFGVTAGVHRLWSHRSYKARLPLRLFLTFCNTLTLQSTIYIWARDHRVHHKFSETDADPYNSRRGFFFSHMGWLMMKKHPQVIEKGKTLDYSDMLADPCVYYQHKFYVPLLLVVWGGMSVYVPHHFWGESPWIAFCTVGCFRTVVCLHCTFLVNSAAHMWGNKPFDRYIAPVQNGFVSFCSYGEGWHNYHHTFPWDYRTAELGSPVNVTTIFLNLMAKIGQAYDLKDVKPEVVLARAQRTGDGSQDLSAIVDAAAACKKD